MLHVRYRRRASVPADELWRAARAVRVNETGMLGRLLRWRIPGVEGEMSFDGLFRESPFTVLAEDDHLLISGLVGRIWTLRRDYPELGDPGEFARWQRRGTARVVFANWASDERDGGSSLESEVRVEAIGAQGRVGVAAVRPLVRAFGPLVATEGISAAVRRAQQGR